MKLKTYTATTMAQALAQVRKDLGTDAMILHTRSYRTGSWLGLGGKPMVEITASSPQPTKSRKSRRVRRAPATEPVRQQEFVEEPIPEIVVQRSRVPKQVPQPVLQPVAEQVHEPAHAEATAQRVPSVQAPADDRAALLQGLTGGTKPLIRDRRFESARRRAADLPEQRSGQPPIDDGFEATTFRTLDPVEDFEPEAIEEKAVVAEQQEAVLIEEKSLDTLEDELFEEQEVVVESEPLLPQGAEAGFEFVMPMDDELTVDECEPVGTTGAVVAERTSIQEPILSESKPAETKPAETKQAALETQALQEQIDTLQKMMGQVLDTTRRTAVAVNKTNPDGALPPVEMSAPLQSLYTGMIDNDVAVDLADRFVGAVRDRLDADELGDASVVRHALLREIESSIGTVSESLLTAAPISDGGDVSRPQVLALIGPTGVGKTTTVAKIAATAKLRQGKRVALITSDTYRIAAVDQLKTYASIIGLDFRIANSPEEMSSVIESLKDIDLVVIDTAGRSQNNHSRLQELGDLISAAQPDETHLVLSSTVGENVLRKTAERFTELGPDRCILTKLDEAVTAGMIAGMSERIGLPLSFITVGQEVPEDILPARAERLARAVLDGPEAVVPGL